MGTLAAFAAELAGRADAELLRLLLQRPDVMSPPVANFASLATRLCATTSINEALNRLNLPQLQTLAALLSGTQCSSHRPFLPELYELGLAMQGPSEHKPSKHDAGTLHFLPVAAVAPALEGSFAAGVPLRPLPPAPESIHVPTRIRDNATASSIDALLRDMAALFDDASADGIAARRGGAVGARPLRALAKSTQLR